MLDTLLNQQIFIGKEIKKILEKIPKEAREKGVTRSALWKIKQKIRGIKLNYKCSAVRKLLS